MSQYSITEQTELPVLAISQLLVQYQSGWQDLFMTDNEDNYLYDNEGNMILIWPNESITPVIQAVILAAAFLFQQIEYSLWQLLTERGISTASGAQLDIIGSLVDLRRNGNTDQIYLSLIHVRIAELNSRGTTPNLINLALLAFPGSSIFIKDMYPASFLLQIIGGFSYLSTGDVGQIFQVAKAGGVGKCVTWDGANGNSFGFAGDPQAVGFGGMGEYVDLLNEAGKPILNEAGEDILVFIPDQSNSAGGNLVAVI